MVWIWIGIGVAAFVSVLVVTAYIAYCYVLKSPDKVQNNPRRPLGGTTPEQEKHVLELIDSMLERPYEQMFVKSYDGTLLAAKYYHVKDGAPLAICFHGYRGVAERDFCGGAPLLLRLGQNVLLVDQRAHRESKGKCLSFGIKERYDCLAWINFACERFGKDVKIFLYGISMGATTVLMASDLNLPDNVRGIVADCPYSSPKDIVCKVCRDKKLFVPIFYPAAWFGGVFFAHINLSKGGAVQSVKNAKVPIVIIHGEADSFVPISMSQKIVAANPNIQFEPFPNAEHGMSYMTDHQRYVDVVKNFLEKHSA